MDTHTSRAAVFDDSTFAFLDAVNLDEEPTRCLDAGCGPGRSTDQLARRFPAATIVGIDSCEHCIRRARRRARNQKRSYIQADVRSALPLRSVDVVFCRALFPHIGPAEAVLNNLASHLSPRGSIIIEEVDAVTTNDLVFRQYLDALPAADASKRVTEAISSTRLGIVSSFQQELRPSAHAVAIFFGSNVARNPERYPAMLAKHLASISANEWVPDRITWTLRRTILRVNPRP